jgi:3-phenylpropionate/cinnamic acid dioxygenase small subunit
MTYLVNADLLREVEQFLYWEARLLDERRFEEWVALFADDVHYWMPSRTTRLRKDLDHELSAEGEVHFLDENKSTLNGRVARLYTGQAWAEEPPSRTQHLISNVSVEEADRPGEYRVFSNFLVYRNRLETEEDFFVGTREDVLRRVDSCFRIARRKIVLAQNVLSAKNLSIFF